jgi:hypothetical protein
MQYDRGKISGSEDQYNTGKDRKNYGDPKPRAQKKKVFLREDEYSIYIS